MLKKQHIVLHDYFASAEGGGRLSSLLAQSLNADLGYGFAKLPHPFIQGTGNNPQEHDLHCHSHIPLWQQYRLAKTFATKTHFLQYYNSVIYSGFYSPLAVKNHLNQQNILYCHTPPRFIYDQKSFYARQIPWILRPLLAAFCDYLQPRYEAAVAEMDVVVANSKHIQHRIQHFLKTPSTVVYPPCETARYHFIEQGDYYLSLGRLDPLKRIDRIIRAFLTMPDKKLLITSGGSEAKRLRQLAGNADNIHFTGWLSDTDLRDYIGRAIACIYIPKDEDFGMSPVEAMAAGKPVLGVAEGGLKETILHEETGYLLPADPSVQSICAGIKWLNRRKALSLRTACQARAKVFDIKQFIAAMHEVLATK